MEDAANDDLEPGTLLGGGRYRIESKLGEGGFGAVYEATTIALSSRVAIKVLNARVAGDPTYVERFKREALVAAKLQSPHVVRMIDVDVGDGADLPAFLVMERLEGRPLTDVIRHEGPLSVERTARLGAQMLSGLAEAHREGVVHRDIKPANLFITTGYDGGEVLKVLDFGVARLVEQEGAPPLTVTGQVLGTLNYMAPEQVAGARVDGRADVYAAATVLWAALVGKPPFSGRVRAMLVQRILVGDYEQLSALKPELGALAALIDRAMSLEPERRPSAEEMASELARWGAGLSGADDTAAEIPATRADPPRERAVPAPKPEGARTRPMLMFALLAAVIGFAVVFAGGRLMSDDADGDAGVGDAVELVERVPSVEPVQAGSAEGLETSDEAGDAGPDSAVAEGAVAATERRFPPCNATVLFNAQTDESLPSQARLAAAMHEVVGWSSRCITEAEPGDFILHIRADDPDRFQQVAVSSRGRFSQRTARCIERLARQTRVATPLDGRGRLAVSLSLRCD